MKVSIVLPTYNEKENIQQLIPLIFKIFDDNRIDGNLIMVDDNSSDGTLQIVAGLQKKYQISLIERSVKMGIGSAYIAGFKKALLGKPEVIFEMDADLSHNPKLIPGFLLEISQGYDMVIGSRRIEGGRIIGWNWTRKLISFGGNLAGKYIAGIDINDLTSGFRAYKKEVLERIDFNSIKARGYAFQLEILARCIKKQFRIKEIPIVFCDRKTGKSKLSNKDIIEFFLTCFKVRGLPFL